MKKFETKLNKISTKTAETRYFPYIFVVFKSQTIYVTFMSFYKNILRREIPIRKSSSICDTKNWKEGQRLVKEEFW